MYIPNANVQDICNTIKELTLNYNGTAIILLSQNQLPNIDSLISELNRMKINFIGGIFPGLIYDSKVCHTGAIILIMPTMQPPVLIKNISKSPNDLENLIDSFKPMSRDNTTAFIIVDCMSSNISTFLSSLYNLLADSVEYIGCGAGFLDFEQKPCIFTPGGFFEDAAIICFLATKCKLGVHHGWERYIGPLVVTKSEGNVVKELNWKNALSVYESAIEADIGKELKMNDFYQISSHYPFGIYIEKHEDLIREVFKTNDKGELFCAGDVPENTILNIMKGTKSSLISSAEKALEDCLLENDMHIEHCFIIDCIGRAIFLQEEFDEELRDIMKILELNVINITTEGVLSGGEIASMNGDMLEYLSKTIVVGLFQASTDTFM
ncbi:FIST signal transduction protein [uncultured Methanomethylovorans sp.]|uniref:FIST signal transduction protein n=1 Tax=uncultured Methanomethylovorans sp. TaxID=183759 RepID=UPI003748BCB4